MSSSGPFEALGDPSQYVTVDLSGDAEEIADALIADSLPVVSLDEVDLAGADGMGTFLELLLTRRLQASIEKDELLAFVERNRALLTATGLLETLPTLLRQATEDEEILGYVRDMTTQMKYALDGYPERVDLVSSRLLWLCYALSVKLERGDCTYPEALAILFKPIHQSRISPRAVFYLIRDFIDSLDSAQPTGSEYVMLLAECALFVQDETCLVASFVLLQSVPPSRDEGSWLDVVERAGEELRRRGRLDDGAQQFLERSRSRFGDLADEEL